MATSNRLRTDLFKTVDREDTRVIAVRDSLTLAEPPLTIQDLDALHCKRGRLGIGWHFVVFPAGEIVLGRGINTCGSHSKDFDRISVGIGVVGGVVQDEKGKRVTTYTQTEEQLEALDDLIEVLKELYPAVEVHDTPRDHSCAPMI